MRAPNKSAAARTVPLPGVDDREQRDYNELDLQAAHLVRLVLWDIRHSGTVRGGHSTHLALAASPSTALCGAKGSPAGEAAGGKVCQACRVAAADKSLGPIGGEIR